MYPMGSKYHSNQIPIIIHLKKYMNKLFFNAGGFYIFFSSLNLYGHPYRAEKMNINFNFKKICVIMWLEVLIFTDHIS